MDKFTDTELRALKAFYDGMQVRSIRNKYCDPWDAVARHRELPRSEYDTVMRILDSIKL